MPRRAPKEKRPKKSKRNPLAEVFGFPVDNDSEEAERHRNNDRCPFNNKGPNCNKGGRIKPLGVCSIFVDDGIAITCPIRLRQDWLIADHAAEFFFPNNPPWTTLLEVKLNDKTGRSAGFIDVVLVAYDNEGKVTDFGALEVQTVYVSGQSMREAYFKPLKLDRKTYLQTDWEKSKRRPPRPDYLSSSRKRLAPQLIYKGGILRSWGKRQAVAMHSAFFATLPKLDEVAREKADVAWLIYDLVHDDEMHRYRLTHTRTVYTKFKQALDTITMSEAGEEENFVAVLQTKLDAKLVGATDDELSDNLDGDVDDTDLLDELENL